MRSSRLVFTGQQLLFQVGGQAQWQRGVAPVTSEASDLLQRIHSAATASTSGAHCSISCIGHETQPAAGSSTWGWAATAGGAAHGVHQLQQQRGYARMPGGGGGDRGRGGDRGGRGFGGRGGDRGGGFQRERNAVRSRDMLARHADDQRSATARLAGVRLGRRSEHAAYVPPLIRYEPTADVEVAVSPVSEGYQDPQVAATQPPGQAARAARRDEPLPDPPMRMPHQQGDWVETQLVFRQAIEQVGGVRVSVGGSEGALGRACLVLAGGAGWGGGALGAGGS